MDQKKILSILIKAANEINKNNEPKANYIHLSEIYIQQKANELNVSFDEMVKIIQKELNPQEL